MTTPSWRSSKDARRPTNPPRAEWRPSRAGPRARDSPFDGDPAVAAGRAFDRVTGELVSVTRLKTYAEALAQYHLNPEGKFRNGDYTDRRLMERRHIVANVVELIGKEANLWEEQVYLGENPEAQIVYGSSQ